MTEVSIRNIKSPNVFTAQNSIDLIQSIHFYTHFIESIRTATQYYLDNCNSESLDICRKIYQLDPENIENLFLIVANNLVIKDSDQAIYYAKQIIQINQNSGEAYYNLGNAYCQKQQYNEAVLCYNKSIEINPFYINSYRNIAIVYLSLGDIKSAIKSYESVIDIYPHPSVYCDIAFLYYKIV